MIVTSHSLDPFCNLAVEEYLLSQQELSCPLLFLWQSQNAVVIGKNQNPWRECDLQVLEDGGGTLARRVSGGGAVYHDAGNLNCTLIMARNEYRENRLYDLVLDTLNGLGIQGELISQNCLAVDGRKFSGNAFCLRKNLALHHCTLLVSTDLKRLTEVLGPTSTHFASHAVRSVPAEVINLTEAAEGLTVEKLRETLKMSFRSEVGSGMVEINADDLPSGEITRLQEKHASWEWRFGQTPDFSVPLEHDFSAGKLSLEIHVHKGCIRDVTPSRSNAAPEKAIDAIQKELVGRPFSLADIPADGDLGLQEPFWKQMMHLLGGFGL